MRGAGAPHRSECPIRIPDPRQGRALPCSASRHLVLGLAGGLCQQGCDEGLPPARGSLQTGCQGASAALHVLVMLVMEAKNTRGGRSHAGGSSFGEQWWRNVDVQRSTVLPTAGHPPRKQLKLGCGGMRGGPSPASLPLHIQQWELWLQPAEVQPLGSPLCQAQRRDMHHGCWNGPFL